jgi:hypothetical protein
MNKDATTGTKNNSRSLEMYFDGSLKLGGAGAGVLFISLDGKQHRYVL